MRFTNPRVSIITLNKGRDLHLQCLLGGLERGLSPHETIVVDMGPLSDRAASDKVKVVSMPSEGLPLAKARNLGRAHATGDVLIFLDVDCIPSSDLVASVPPLAVNSGGLVCCEVFYLPGNLSLENMTEHELVRSAVPHPERAFPKEGVIPAPNPGLFWSLAFAVKTATFDAIGGFDEIFSGYGAEDTDFAFRAVDRNVPIFFTATGRAYHQYHGVYDPPLHHFVDIVRNANIFKQRHGTWAMRGWLDAFERLGLTSERDGEVVILRMPSSAEIQACRLPGNVPF